MSKSFPFLLASWQWSSNNPSHHLKPSYLTVLSYASNTQLFLVSKSAFLRSAGFKKRTSKKCILRKNDAWKFYFKMRYFDAHFGKRSFDIFINHIDSDIGLVWINLHVRVFQETLQLVERLRANIFSLKII